MKIIFLFFGLMAVSACQSISTPPLTKYNNVVKANLMVIPTPKTYNLKGGELALPAGIAVICSDKSLAPIAKVFQKNILLKCGLEVKLSQKESAKGAIKYILNKEIEPGHYKIEIDHQIIVSASDYAAMINGSSTLLQLITRTKDGKFSVPKLKIVDQPAVNYRGVMIDTARQWNPAEIIIQTLDLMHYYKYNVLMIHLSDHQSYTLPSKVFPKLPSYRKNGARWHYTFEEIKAIVDYAAQLAIEIIPEVDTPGHAGTLVKQVPEYFGYKDPKTGKYVGRGGVVNMISEKTYQGMDLLIGEICELFPNSTRIHIGCDEVWAVHLKKYPGYKEYCQIHKLPKAEKGNTEELLCHYIGRLDQIVRKHGCRTVIWEGFQGIGTPAAPVSTNILTMAWNTQFQPPQSLIKNGFDIINCCWLPLYIVPPQNRLSTKKNAFDWDQNKFDHWKKGIKKIQLEEKMFDKVKGAQICYWEQWPDMVMDCLEDLMPVVSERIWNPNSGISFKQFEAKEKTIARGADFIVRPVRILCKGSFKDNSHFTGDLKVEIDSNSKGIIKYTIAEGIYDYPTSASAEFKRTFKISETCVISAALFDSKANQISPVTQKRLTKIVPAYYYKAYIPKGINNFEDLPNFDQLTPDREGVLGLASDAMVAELNRILIDVNREGYVNIRPENMWNNYAIQTVGQIKFPSSGKYAIKLVSKDGTSNLYIDGKRVAYPLVFGGEDSYEMEIKAGTYAFEIEHFYRYLNNELNIQVKVPGRTKFIPFENLVLPIAEHLSKSKLSHLPKKLNIINLTQKANWNYAINRPVKTIPLDNVNKKMGAKYAVDGNCNNNSSWFTASTPQTLEIDMGSPQNIDRIRVVFYYDGNRYYQYNIASSTDGIDWGEVVDMSENKQKSTKKGITHKFEPRLARFIRINVTKNSANRGIHLNEVMVYGPDMKLPE